MPDPLIEHRLDLFRKAVGPRYADESFDTFRLYTNDVESARQREAIAAVRRYLVDLPDRLVDGAGLVLRGSVGTGKDHIMAAAAMEVIGRGLWVSWTDGMSLFGKVREYAGPVPKDGVADRLIRQQIVAISDPVPPSGSLESRQSAWLLTLIHERYKQHRPTWVSLNARTEEECVACLGPQIWDRLRHAATVVTCDWRSYRVAARPNTPRPRPKPRPDLRIVPESSASIPQPTPEQIERASRKFSFQPKEPPSAIDVLPDAEHDRIVAEQTAKAFRMGLLRHPLSPSSGENL